MTATSSSPDTAPVLLTEQRGQVLWLTINREVRRNAVNHTVLASLSQAISQAQQQRDFQLPFPTLR